MNRYESLALGDAPSTNVGEVVSPLADVYSPATQFPYLFALQSYFDSTLLEKALLTQNPVDGIVASTEQVSQASGYSLGLAPWSQTPVAVQFLSGGMQDSPIYTLKPGQIIRPYGRPDLKRAKQFSGFRYGLPMGWLGGGLANLVVFHTPDAKVDWSTATEVIFHRARFNVYQPSGFNNIDAPNNWPTRFPWPFAVRGASSISQKTSPVLAIAEGTRALVVLRTGNTTPGSQPTSGSPASMRVVYQATNDVGLDSAGVAVLTSPIFEDITWQGWTNIGTAGDLATADPAQMLTGIMARVSADIGGIAFLDISGGSLFTGMFVDVCRYGKL